MVVTRSARATGPRPNSVGMHRCWPSRHRVPFGYRRNPETYREDSLRRIAICASVGKILLLQMKVSKSLSAKPGSWTRDEIQKLQRVYGSKTKNELARIFGRSHASIEGQAKRLQLAKNKVFVKRHLGEGIYKMPHWTPAEISELKKIYANVSNLEVARKMKRSIGSVVSQANKLGLYKSAKRMKGMGQENIRGRWGAKPRARK